VSGGPGLVAMTWPEKTFPFPQDPTACLEVLCVIDSFHSGKPVVLVSTELIAPHVNVPPMS
jgi:hypothetical protein